MIKQAETRSQTTYFFSFFLTTLLLLVAPICTKMKKLSQANLFCCHRLVFIPLYLLASPDCKWWNSYSCPLTVPRCLISSLKNQSGHFSPKSSLLGSVSGLNHQSEFQSSNFTFRFNSIYELSKWLYFRSSKWLFQSSNFSSRFILALHSLRGVGARAQEA